MRRAGGWTRAGSLNTITLAHGVSCQGASYAILAPAPLPCQRLRRPGPLARPLHALGGLANNHFLHIRDFLDHALLRGGYTHLMPHYLFAVLFEKVRVLRRLSQERHGWRGTAEPNGLVEAPPPPV